MKKQLELRIKIRKMQPSDIPAVLKLGAAERKLWSSPRDDAFSKSATKAWKAWLRIDDTLLVAESGGRPVGFLAAEVRELKPGGWCYLDYLAVEKKHRGKGIGSALLKALEKELKRKKIGRLYVSTSIGDKRLLRWWQKHGYRPGYSFTVLEKKVSDYPW